MRTFSILLLALFASFSVAYTQLNAENQEESKKQEDDGGSDMKALMKELIKGAVAQVQEEEGRKLSFAELESTLDSILLQGEEEGGDGAQGQEDNDNGDDLLAFLQGDDDLAEVQDDDNGGDATSQGLLGAIRIGVLTNMRPEDASRDAENR